MLLYLDQNYASRIAKFLLGQRGQEHFGTLHDVLLSRDLLIPPSPFHVLELREGYLLPTFKSFFAEVSKGYWVRPWREVLEGQLERGGLERGDLLSPEGSWQRAADLSPLEGILELELRGSFLERSWRAKDELCRLLGIGEAHSYRLPFMWLLSRLLAFRSLEAERYARPSDLNDLVMAATVGPYVDVLATDRYVREIMQRVGYEGQVYSGRRHEVLRLVAMLKRGGGDDEPC